jgi:hypothetical protein
MQTVHQVLLRIFARRGWGRGLRRGWRGRISVHGRWRVGGLCRRRRGLRWVGVGGRRRVGGLGWGLRRLWKGLGVCVSVWLSSRAPLSLPVSLSFFLSPPPCLSLPVSLSCSQLEPRTTTATRVNTTTLFTTHSLPHTCCMPAMLIVSTAVSRRIGCAGTLKSQCPGTLAREPIVKKYFCRMRALMPFESM